MNAKRGVSLLAAAALLGTGCAMVKLHGQSRAYYESTVLAGRVAAPLEWKGPVVVAAREAPAGAVAHDVRLHEAGGFELIVPAGRYEIVAFGDANGNGRHDAGEPAGRYEAGPVAADGTGLLAGLDVAIRPGARPTALAGLAPRARVSTQAGVVSRLDDTMFAADAGRRGYWEPMEAFRETGGNVHFLEPYDPARIPVLFVHGAAGSARDWQPVVAALDRSRYQAWLYHYPSGASVRSMAHLLYWKLLNLQLRHRFDSLHVVAHSMGGLVVRRFLLDHGAHFPQVRLFVSLATPWGGEPTADLGVRASPSVIPSWRDMQPEGEFMRALFERELPRGIDYYLLFGHRGGYNLLRPTTDGTVTLASQLRPPAQAEARGVHGFDEDHMGILSSPQVHAQLAALLDSASRRSAGEAARSGGVRLRFDLPAGPGIPIAPVLMLAPHPLAPGRIFLPLDASDDGREIGPIPPGAYEASLVVPAFRGEPARQRVVVTAGEAPTLRFRLVPQGALAGSIGARRDPIERPAGSYRRAGEGVIVRSIELAGEGVRRVVAPRAIDEGAILDRNLAGEDAASHAYFSFVGLPAGDYVLRIEAEGFPPHESRHRVVPGRPAADAVVELRR